MKKIFGGVNLTWPKVIIMSFIIGIYTAIMAMLKIAHDTSFSDLTVSFEVWIFFGIFIIMNSKSPKDSALKCFVFFLISQPLIYLVQDIINGSHLFGQYYKYWFIWTVFCLPMGFIGYYIKKNKWWGILILAPILALLGKEFYTYLSKTVFSFPRHFLTLLFCLATLITYPLVVFKNKIAKYIGITISCLLIIVLTIICIMNPMIYKTDILVSGEKNKFDDSYKAYLMEKKYGELSIRYEPVIEDWIVHAEFKKAGKTEFVLESPDGEKTKYDISIMSDKYILKEKKN